VGNAPVVFMASFDEKVEALRRLRDRHLARSGREKLAASDDAGPDTLQNDIGKQWPVTPSALLQPDEPAETAHAKFLPKAGEADALFCAGHCYEHGLHDCEVNPATAFELYEQAASRGHTAAHWRLGELLERGHGVEKCEQRSAQFYRQAAEAGHAQAQISLGLLFEDGRGVVQDDAQAFKWFRAAAEQDEALAQYCAACCLAEGRGAHRNISEATHLLTLSAAAGFGPAASLLEEVNGTSAHLAAPEIHQSADADVGFTTLELAERLAAQFADLDDETALQVLAELQEDDPGLLDDLDLGSESEGVCD